jgi:acyl-CoA synthetase (AMP-forming)/AMP-acid ligase II
LKQSQASGIFVQTHYRGRDLVAVIQQVQSELPRLREVISLSSWQDFLQSAPPIGVLPSVGPDDIAQTQYTSGTTGFPKGARLTHRGLGNNGRFFARTVGAGPDDVWVNPMPMFHTAGCGLCTLGALQTGGTQVLPPGYDPELMLRVRARARYHHALRSDHAHSDARLSIHRTEKPVVLAAGYARRRAGSTRTGAASARAGREGCDRVWPDRGLSVFDAYAARRSSQWRRRWASTSTRPTTQKWPPLPGSSRWLLLTLSDRLIRAVGAGRRRKWGSEHSLCSWSS